MKKQRNLISVDRVISSLGITIKQWMASKYSGGAIIIAGRYYYDVPDLLKKMKLPERDAFPFAFQKASYVAWLLDKSADTILRWARAKKVKSWKFGPHTYRFNTQYLSTTKRGSK